MTTLETIENQLKKVKNKKALSRQLAFKMDRSIYSIYNNWILETAIPEKHQSEVLEFINDYLKAEK